MYGFIAVSGVIMAVPAPPGANLVTVGGILYHVREPASADEREAAARADRDARRDLSRPRVGRLSANDIVGLMAAKIIERARAAGEVQRTDFHQAGVPDAEIESHRDAAFARARRLEPGLDAMAACA